MLKRKILLLLLFCAVFMQIVCLAYGSVTLNVEASNPSEYEDQEVKVKSYLPQVIRSEHVLDSGELEVQYDIDKDQYYVYKNVILKPGERRSFAIVIEDVWALSEQELEDHKAHVKQVVQELVRSDHAKVAERLQQKITDKIDTILKKQREASVENVSIVHHISAHNENLKLFSSVRSDIGVLENLVVSSGGNLEKIMGETSIGATLDSELEKLQSEVDASEKRVPGKKQQEAALPDSDKKMAPPTIVLRLEVENPSEREVQEIPLQYFLPSELTANDVIEAGELELAYDFGKSQYYLYKDAIVLKPGEKKVYEIIVVDKWTIRDVDVLALKAHTEKLVEEVQGLDELSSVEGMGKDVLARITGMLEQERDTELSKKKITQFREDQETLQEIEKKIQRMEDMMKQAHIEPGVTLLDKKQMRRESMKQVSGRTELDDKDAGEPEGKKMEILKRIKIASWSIFKGKKPDKATTWRVIYGIIGFLAIISIIVLLVWSSQAKKKKDIEEIKHEPEKKEDTE